MHLIYEFKNLAYQKLTLFHYISVEGIITDDDGIDCTPSHECKIKCYGYITITFSTPQYLVAFAAGMPGLEQETSHGTHHCYFRPTVVFHFQEVEKKYSGTKILHDTTETVVNKPADTVKLQSICMSGTQCVFKVTETDVNNWTGLNLTGSL